MTAKDVINGDTGQGWVVRVLADGPAAGAFETAIEDGADAVSSFEIAPGGAWRIEAYCRDRPDRGRLETRLALAAAGASVAVPRLLVEALRDVDWVAENQASFPPLRIGRFFIHGSHVTDPPPAGSIPLLIDAGAAFGTGEHATTQGCLLAIEQESRRRGRRRPLDVGCGTGVLAMALARRLGVAVLGTDLHADSVRVARVNARRNRLSPLAGGARVRFEVADGVRHRAVRGRHDIIVANILAGPLCALAPALRRRLQPGGRLILSGLLAWQEARVLSAYRQVGIRLRTRHRIDGWSTLVLG